MIELTLLKNRTKSVLSPLVQVADGLPRHWEVMKMEWLRMIKDYVAHNFHIDQDDFDLNPSIASGGPTKMWNLFSKQRDEIINELNEALTA